MPTYIRAVLLTVSATVLLAQDLVPNGDMTQGSRLPAHWDTVWQPEGSSRVAVFRDSDVFASAPASLRFENPEGIPFANVSRVFPVTPGSTLVITAAIRRDDAIESAVLALQGAGEIWVEIVAARDGASGWQRGATSYRVPDGIHELTILLLTSGAGTAWLDDVNVAVSP